MLGRGRHHGQGGLATPWHVDARHEAVEEECDVQEQMPPRVRGVEVGLGLLRGSILRQARVEGGEDTKECKEEDEAGDDKRLRALRLLVRLVVSTHECREADEHKGSIEARKHRKLFGEMLSAELHQGEEQERRIGDLLGIEASRVEVIGDEVEGQEDDRVDGGRHALVIEGVQRSERSRRRAADGWR